MSHPLDRAISFIRRNIYTSICNPDITLMSSDAERLASVVNSVSTTVHGFLGNYGFHNALGVIHDWLEKLGIENPWLAMCEEYDRAKAKHGDMTLDSDKPTDEQRYYAVIEEVGEVARALTYDQDHAGNLEEELTQLGALLLAWVANKIRKGRYQ